MLKFFSNLAQILLDSRFGYDYIGNSKLLQRYALPFVQSPENLN